MSLEAALCLCLMAATIGSAADSNPPLACNLKAIDAKDRPRYAELMKRLRASVVKQAEVADGYAYTLDSRGMPLPEVAEWITMERLCCPFLAFQLDVTSTGGTLLTLRGPNGVKTILREEFPVAPVR